MITSYLDKAIRFESQPCRDCQGTGQVVILDRAKTFSSGKPQSTRLKCPVCGGSGRCGIRVK